MNEREIAISTIQYFIDECLFDPWKGWPRYEREKRIYEQWGAHELIAYLNTHWDEDTPQALIRAFVAQMDRFSELDEDSRASRMFIYARDIAADILRFVF